MQSEYSKATPALDVRLLIIISLFAIATSCAYFLDVPLRYQPDSSSYMTPAQNLLNRHAFLNEKGYPETVRTPGYPVVIAPFLWAGLDLKYLVIFQHLLRVAVILAACIFAFSLARSLRQAILTAVLLCIDLPLLSAANTVLTEMVFTTVLCLALWLIWTDSEQAERGWPWSLAYGFLCGLLVLIRPVGLFFIVPAMIYLLLARRTQRWQATLSLFLAFAIPPLAWASRNYREAGYFTVSSISSDNLLLYRATGALAMDDPGDFSTNFEKRFVSVKTQVCNDLSKLYQRDCFQIWPQLRSEYELRLARQILLTHRLAYAKLVARGAAIMMLGGDASSLAQITGLNPHLGVRVLLIYTMPVFCFAVAGLFRFWKENRKFFWFALLTIGYFVLISAGAEAYSRFRVPIIPLYAVLSASGIDLIGRSRAVGDSH